VGDVNKTNLFSADGKPFYFNKTDVSELALGGFLNFLLPEFCTNLIFYFKGVTWYKARKWCTKRGMQLANLKTLVQVEAVAKELRSRVWGKEKSKKAI
jgi:hypothetical protein